jgi:DNA-directed RNA polymerase subunit RPC12/RpoP
MKSARDDEDMRCPKCRKYELRESDSGVECRVCGYRLSPGQVDRFRLYRMLREESKASRR